MKQARGSTLATREDNERHYKDAITLLRSVRVTLAEMLEQVLDGGAGALRDIAAKHGELESALRRAFEAETRWNDWSAKQDNAPVAGEIDLASIRENIACRLARLRECCQEEA